MITQMSIFDFNEKELISYEKQLSDLENRIKVYVYENHRGRTNGVSMNVLAEKFDVSTREIRDYMANITEKSIIDFDSGDYGYFACLPGEPRDHNRVKRTIGSMRRIVTGNPNKLALFYEELNKLKSELT